MNPVTIVFITGLSGVGKSSVLKQLEKEGYRVVDTDYGYTTKVTRDGMEETIWDAGKISELLDTHKNHPLFISGCYSNQGEFYHHFDHVVLLTAELDVMLARIEGRVNNDFGKNPNERFKIIQDHKNVLPLLEKKATTLIDTTNISISEVGGRLKALLEMGS